MSVSPVHELEYRAGTSGFGRFGTADDVPHWYCTCGGWRVNRDMRTGSPVKETVARKHRNHVRDVEM